MNDLIEFSRKLAEASGDIIRYYFYAGADIGYKPDLSPVTIADRKAEEVMRQMIRECYPDHGVMGEEFGNINPEAEYQWALDPIDGTNAFISGVYLFGTLIALMKKDRPILGVINNPIENQFLVGNGEQTWLNGETISVRSCQSIEKATLLTTSPLSIDQYREGAAFTTLTRRVRLYRTWGDAYGYLLVATGRADIMVDPAMSVWDVAALVPIIEGAGGVITDYYGGEPMSGKGAVATAGQIHADVIRALNPNKC